VRVTASEATAVRSESRAPAAAWTIDDSLEKTPTATTSDMAPYAAPEQEEEDSAAAAQTQLTPPTDVVSLAAAAARAIQAAADAIKAAPVAPADAVAFAADVAARGAAPKWTHEETVPPPPAPSPAEPEPPPLPSPPQTTAPLAPTRAPLGGTAASKKSSAAKASSFARRTAAKSAAAKARAPFSVVNDENAPVQMAPAGMGKGLEAAAPPPAAKPKRPLAWTADGGLTTKAAAEAAKMQADTVKAAKAEAAAQRAREQVGLSWVC
jgi:hypothetical protein